MGRWRRNKRGGCDVRKSERARIKRMVSLRPGERLMPFYCWDKAWCDCEPTTTYLKIPCVSAGVRYLGPHRRAARCLGCGVRWLVPEHRRADRTPAGGAR
jgi:hypothetical protein